MCYSVHRYDCGHTRKYKTACRRRGRVSAFIKRVFYDEVCNGAIEKRRHRLCRACDSHHDGRHGRRKHKRSERASRKQEHHDDLGSARNRCHHREGSARGRSTRETNTKLSQRHESPTRRDTSETLDYAAWRGDWEVSDNSATASWVKSPETECFGPADQLGEYTTPGASDVAQGNAKTMSAERNSFDARSATVLVLPVDQPSPSPTAGSQYIPSRSVWPKIPSPPSYAYRPSLRPRPPSSIYPSVAGCTAPSLYSAANESDFFTIYVESEVPAKEPEPFSLFQPQSATDSEPRRDAGQQWPRSPPLPSHSRFANLPATGSDFVAQSEPHARAERLGEAQRKAADGENARLIKGQETWREVGGGFEAIERSSSQEGGFDRRSESRSISPLYEPRHSEGKASNHDMCNPIRRANTDKHRNRSNVEDMDSSRPYSAPGEQSDKIWDPVLKRFSPKPTPSTFGSQIFENPRVAPRPRPSTHEIFSQRGAGCTELRRSQDTDTTVSSFYPRPGHEGPGHEGPHGMNPCASEDNRGATSGQRSSKLVARQGSMGSALSSKSQKTARGSSASPLSELNRISKDLLGKFHLRKQPSDTSFMCVDVAKHDAQFRTPGPPSEPRKKP